MSLFYYWREWHREWLIIVRSERIGRKLEGEKWRKRGMSHNYHANRRKQIQERTPDKSTFYRNIPMKAKKWNDERYSPNIHSFRGNSRMHKRERIHQEERLMNSNLPYQHLKGESWSWREGVRRGESDRQLELLLPFKGRIETQRKVLPRGIKWE